MKSQLINKIAELKYEVESVRKEGELVRAELADFKFQMHGLTDTYRRDKVLNTLKNNVKEVEMLFDDCERERTK